MRKLCLLVGLGVALPLVWAGPAAAHQYGEIRMTIHTHSHDDPDWPGLLFETDRLSYNFVQGENFSYSSRTCAGRAPFNDIGLNFIPNYPGVDDDADGTAKVRHHVEGTVTAVGPTSGVIQGKITTVLCEGAAETQHSIVSYFWVRYTRAGPDALLVSGAFRISPTESTGTFRDMQGGGRIEGRFTCLGAPVCAQLGYFTDFVGHTGDPSLPAGQLQPGALGTYYDPTVTTRSAA